MKLTPHGRKVGGQGGTGVKVDNVVIVPGPGGTASATDTRAIYRSPDAQAYACDFDGSNATRLSTRTTQITVAGPTVWGCWEGPDAGQKTFTSFAADIDNAWAPMAAGQDDSLLLGHRATGRGLRCYDVAGTVLWEDGNAVICFRTLPQAFLLDAHRCIWSDPAGNLYVRGLPTPQQRGPAFDPFALTAPDGTIWVGYHNDRFIMHPISDASRGYILDTGLTYGTTTNGSAVGWSRDEAEGKMDALAIDWSWPLVDLTPPVSTIPGVNRALWFGFFEFAGATDCPVNCRLKVEQGQPWLMVRDIVASRPIYRYVAGEPDGDVDAIDRAVATAKAVGDGLPTLAYVPRQASAVRIPDAVVGIECYRRNGESEADFERYIRQTAARCQRVVLIVQCYTSNATLTKDLRSIPPVIARVARDVTNVEGVIVFSGSGRGTGFQDHPDVQPDWRMVAASITAPVVVIPTPPVIPPPVVVPPTPPIVPPKENIVTPDQIAQVLAGTYFEGISTLLELPGTGVPGTEESRRSAVHAWVKDWVVFLFSEYQRLFGRDMDLEAAGSRVLLAVQGKSKSWMTTMLEKAKAEGAK